MVTVTGRRAAAGADGGPAVTLYAIAYRTRSGVQLRCEKRYSDVARFHERMKSDHPDLLAFRFPNRSIFNTMSAHTVERRRAGFAEYFAMVQTMPEFADRLEAFLREGAEEEGGGGEGDGNDHDHDEDEDEGDSGSDGDAAAADDADADADDDTDDDTDDAPLPKPGLLPSPLLPPLRRGVYRALGRRVAAPSLAAVLLVSWALLKLSLLDTLSPTASVFCVASLSALLVVCACVVTGIESVG